MKNRTIISGIIGLLCTVQFSMAAEPDHAADHDALRALRGKAEQAINAGDMKALHSCMAKKFTFITSDQTVLTSLTDLEAYWKKMFAGENALVTSMTSTFTANDLTQFIAPDAGYCQGTSRDVYTLKNNRKVAVKTTWTSVMIKENGEWKISSAHIAVNFLDNPIIETRSLSWFGKLGVWLHLKKLPGEVNE